MKGGEDHHGHRTLCIHSMVLSKQFMPQKTYQKNIKPKGIIFCQVKEEIPRNFFSSGAAANTGLASAEACTRTDTRRGS